MTIDEKRNRIEAIIDEMSVDEIICAWNQRCESYNDWEQYIYPMDSFDELMNGQSPTEIVEALGDGFSTADDYFCDDIYGLKSFDDIYEVADDSELLDYILDEDDDIDNCDIREILDEDEDEEEDEEEDKDLYLEDPFVRDERLLSSPIDEDD